MKKQILGLFAIIILSATTISATKKSSVITTANGTYMLQNDTAPNRMHRRKNSDTSYPNRMDTSMNHYRDTTHRDSTHK